MSFWASIGGILREADVVLLICDARMPELSRNRELEEKMSRYGRKMIIVYNKVDLVSNKDLNKLREENKEAFFVSGSKNQGIGKLRIYLNILGKKYKGKRIKVGIVGYPNVGKSSIINCLAFRARTATSSVAGTTKGPQFVKIGSRIKIIDSPGVIPPEDNESKLALISAKNPEKLKNPEKVALEVISMLLRKDKKILENYYKIKISNLSLEEILWEIGKHKGMLKKKGIVDETKTAFAVIMDWQKG